MLAILTDVDGVYERYGQPDERVIDELTVDEAARLLEDLPEGSMRPKLEAALGFVRDGGKLAVIASLDAAPEAIEGKAGTRIV